RDGSWFSYAGPGVSIRPSSALEARFGIDLNRNMSDAQWVQKVTSGADAHYVFGRLDQTTMGVSMRLNYTLTSRLSLQLYGQPFVSTGDYSHFKELVNGRAARYDDRYATFAYSGSPNFNYHSFRTTNVLRWEYRPGSTLFVVWQQARENYAVPGGFQFGRDMHDIFGVAPRNEFLVKLAYCLNY